MYIYIRTYIHTYVHTYIHTYIHTSIHTYAYTLLHHNTTPPKHNTDAAHAGQRRNLPNLQHRPAPTGVVAVAGRPVGGSARSAVVQQPRAAAAAWRRHDLPVSGED